jgi:hypothetical protein
VLSTYLKPSYFKPPPDEQYVIDDGDAGAGVGATPSVMAIAERRALVQIGELGRPAGIRGEPSQPRVVALELQPAAHGQHPASD